METSNVSTRKTRYYTYILLSLKDKGLYIGFTSNLKKRLTQHAKNQVRSTTLRTPFELIYYEYFISKDDALAREKFLKSGFGRQQLAQILKKTMTSYKHSLTPQTL